MSSYGSAKLYRGGQSWKESRVVALVVFIFFHMTSDGQKCALNRIPRIIARQNQLNFFTPGAQQSGRKALFLFVLGNYDIGNAFPA